jgi:Tol biopolymer transport system component
MRTCIAAVVVAVLLAGLCVSAPAGTCVGDCSGDGTVTVDEVILGVNIALGTTPLSQCPLFDGSADSQVTVDELVTAVNDALNGCPTGNYAGSYAAMVTFDPSHSGVVNLTADTTSQISGSLVVLATEAASLGSAAGFSFSFPAAGVSVAASGTYDPNGGFEVSGSFVDAGGQSVDVTLSGDLPGATGSTPLNVYIGSDLFTTTLSAGMLPTPTVGPGPTPTPVPSTGQRIVFAAMNPTTFDPADIFVINTDGTGKTLIHSSATYDTNPAWSPDGTQIACSTASGSGVGIAVMNADGSNVRVLTGPDGSPLDYNPAWSPDGSKIAFTAGSGDAIDVMNADGSDRRRLVTQTVGEAYNHLSWSPDGSRIAVETTRPQQSGSADRLEIWVMNADGSNFVRLTNNSVPDRHPDWTPNAQKILFARDNSFNGGIFTINPDGSGEMRIIFDSFFTGPLTANWSLDGQQIAYPTLFGIKITNASGGNAVTVPNTQFVTDFDLK